MSRSNHETHLQMMRKDRRLSAHGDGPLDFIIAKIIGALIVPSSAFVIAISLFTLGLWTPLKRFCQTLLAISVAGLLTIIILPVGYWLMVPLEQRFAMPERYPDQIDGVIVLGNGPNGHISAARDEAAISEPGERFAAMVELARQFPAAKLVFSGGSGSILDVPMTEAQAISIYFERLGLAPERVIFEDRSRNTYENARYTTELIQPEEGERWLLVTSAKDMPRAYGVFIAQGFNVEPWLVDFLTVGEYEMNLSFRVSQRLWQMDQAVHEWLGMLVYYWRGWTTELFPGPG